MARLRCERRNYGAGITYFAIVSVDTWSIGVAESREVAPGVDEGGLDGVLGSMQIAKDRVRDRKEPIAGHGHQAGVRFFVTLYRPFDEKWIHVVGAPSCIPDGTLHP